MQYPIVYDKFETSFAKLGLAVLHQARSVKIKETINGEYTLSFILPRNDSKWQYIQSENFVKVKDQLFRIRSFDEEYSKGKLKSNVQCEHVYYDSNDCKHIPYFEMLGAAPRSILQSAFSGTRFTIGTVEVTTLTDISDDKSNPCKIATKLINKVGGELIKDNWTINLVQKRGSSKGIQFRVDKNTDTVKKTTDSKNLFTRLYPYGKDGLDITSINSNGYIDSPFASTYDRPKITYKEYKDIDNPAELLTEAQKEFSTDDTDGIDKPKVTINAEIIELKKLKEYGDFEKFELGDTVKVYVNEIGVNTNQRIMEYEEYPYEAQRSSVVLANYSPKKYSKESDEGTLLGFLETSQSLSKVTTATGKVNVSWLENIKAKLSTLFNSSLQNAVMHNIGDIWVDNIDNPTKAIGIVADGFAIADGKKANGDWNWQTFGTAEGFTAELINTGILNCTLVNVKSDNGNLEIQHNTVYIKDTNNVTRLKIGEISSGVFGQQIFDKNAVETIGFDDNGKVVVKGKITSSDIDVTSDVLIGKILKFRASFEGGIEWWDTSTQTKVGQIYVDPALKTLIISLFSGVYLPSDSYLNGQLIASQNWVTFNFAPKSHTHDYTTLSTVNNAIDDAIDDHVAAYHT